MSAFRSEVSILAPGLSPPLASCAEVLRGIESCRTNDCKRELVQSGWHTCLVQNYERTAPAYPTDVWNRYLKTHAIREKFIIDDAISSGD